MLTIRCLFLSIMVMYAVHQRVCYSDSVLELFPEYQTMKGELNNLKSRVDGLTTEANSETVSFYAYGAPSSGFLPTWAAKSVVTFTAVKMNNGNGFTTSTGRFRAPKAGLYHFMFSVTSQFFTQSYYDIMKNNDKYAFAPVWPHSTVKFLYSGRQSWIARLNQGDEMYIKQTGNQTYIFDAYYAGFFVKKQ